ncbi:MAG: hypothetical protein CM15mP14_3420 [Rhodospirillaceae bacterium]|nr:MAG: hypothetical protein CM15mP14_3420 [Rhodospirillaceae bacterium]
MIFLISDKFNPFNQAEGFIENRHDPKYFLFAWEEKGFVSIKKNNFFGPPKTNGSPFFSVGLGHGLKK